MSRAHAHSRGFVPFHRPSVVAKQRCSPTPLFAALALRAWDAVQKGITLWLCYPTVAELTNRRRFPRPLCVPGLVAHRQRPVRPGYAGPYTVGSPANDDEVVRPRYHGWS